MLQSVDHINNNPISDYSQRRVVSELRQNNAAPDCLRQFLEIEKSAAQTVKSLNPEVSFLESDRLGSKPTLDVYAFEKTLRTLPLERVFTSQTSTVPTRTVVPEGVEQIYKSLPFYTSWFDFDAIHPIERQFLPEFFGEKSSKTPKIYQRLRNFLVQLYWKNPRVSLLATTARRCVALDACCVLRVHSFLEKWGLINLQSKNKTPNFQNPMNLDFVKQSGPERLIAESESALNKAPFRESSFETSLIEAGFKRMGLGRQKCFQCQNLLQTCWFSRTNDSVSVFGGEKPISCQPENSMNICPSCQFQGHFPVFYSPTDFKYVTLSKCIAETCLSGLDVVCSLKTEEQITQFLTNSKLESITFADCVNAFPEAPEDQLLIAALKVLETVQTQQEAMAESVKIDKVKTKTDSMFKMDRMLAVLCDKMGIATHEPVHRGKSRESLVKPFVQFNNDIEQAFLKRAEKATLRFAFLDDFEKVLYQEKHNLKAFN